MTTPTPHLIETAADALTFAFGGSARFTLVSKETGKRYTFRIAKNKNDDHMFFASLLTGPNNTEDYEYLGFIRTPEHKLVAGRKGNPNHPAFVALAWALRRFDNDTMPSTLEFWHEGRCMRCARVLTDPASIERGLGPECAGKV